MSIAARKLMDVVSGGVVDITLTANPVGVSHVNSIVTYSSQSIGEAASDRIVVLCVLADKSGASPESATIDYGSGAMSMNSTAVATISGVYARIFYLAAPTGTTATFAITFTAASNPSNSQNKVVIYRVTGASTTPAATGTDTSSNMGTDPLTTGSLTITTNGGFIGAAASQTQGQTMTWTNATEDVDASGGNFQYSTASREGGGSVTITCQSSNTNEDGSLAFIVFNPS